MVSRLALVLNRSHTDRNKIDRSSLAGSLALAAMATIMRPSNVVIWLVLGLHLVLRSPTVMDGIKIMRVALTVGYVVSQELLLT